MGLSLWGRDRTANVQKALWCLDEIGLQFTHHEGGYAPATESDAAYLTMKRQAAFLPVIEDDGFVLWEANAIIRYLADTRASPPLWPASAAGRL